MAYGVREGLSLLSLRAYTLYSSIELKDVYQTQSQKDRILNNGQIKQEHKMQLVWLKTCFHVYVIPFFRDSQTLSVKLGALSQERICSKEFLKESYFKVLPWIRLDGTI